MSFVKALISQPNRFCLLILSLFLAAAVFQTSPAMAAPELRVGYVDLQKALAQSRAGKVAQKSYQTEVQKAQSELDKKKTEFESLKKNLEKQRDSLNDNARIEKEEKLISLEKDIKRSFRDAQETLRRKNSILVGELVKDIRKVVDEVGRSQGFTIILEKGSQAVLYADSKIDITDSVVEKFNQRKK